jgi:hypothetical protein
MLGMSWMRRHKAVLDISARLVHLNSPVYGKVTMHLSVISHIKASLHHVVERGLEDIHVVHEFPDVFPDDLPGMPPERAIEFKIELQPGTAPISKELYKMSEPPHAASPRPSRPHRRRCPKPRHRRVRIPPLSGRPTPS